MAKKPKTSYTIYFYTEEDGAPQKKIAGYISAYSVKQALMLFKRGHGRHLMPGLVQVASLSDRLRAEAK